MNTRLTKTQKNEIFGNWKFFDDCSFADVQEVNDLKYLSREQVKEILCHAGAYQDVGNHNKAEDYFDQNVQRAWAGFEKSMISLQAKCDHLLKKELENEQE